MTTAAVNPLLVQSYATNVYLTGRTKLANIAIMRPDYVQPVMQYAADKYYIEYIDAALTNGYIAAIEHAETVALKDPTDPWNMPQTMLEEQGLV